MYGKIGSRIKCALSNTPGTSAAILGAAVAGFLSMSGGGVNDGDLVSGCFEDGTNFEFGVYAWNASTSTLTRTAANVAGGSSGVGTLISLTSAATFMVTPIFVDLAEAGVRQTVVSGPLSSGAPNFLAATYASLVVTTQNLAAAKPLLATAAAGWGASGQIDLVGAAIANLSWTVSANATSFLPVAINVAGGMTAATPTTLVPIYQWSGAPSTTNGQYTFNVSEMQMYLGNGSAANKVAHVIVGEVVAGASTVTSAIAYAYNGYYDSGWTNTIPDGVLVSKNSNLGCGGDFASASATMQCISADVGYAVGDQIDIGFVSSGWTIWQNRNACGIAAVGTFSLTNKGNAGSLGVQPVDTKWKYKIRHRRLF